MRTRSVHGNACHSLSCSRLDKRAQATVFTAIAALIVDSSVRWRSCRSTSREALSPSSRKQKNLVVVMPVGSVGKPAPSIVNDAALSSAGLSKRLWASRRLPKACPRSLWAARGRARSRGGQSIPDWLFTWGRTRAKNSVCTRVGSGSQSVKVSQAPYGRRSTCHLGQRSSSS
jgi:hypothetical protein